MGQDVGDSAGGLGGATSGLPLRGLVLGAEHRGDLSGHRLVTKRVLRGAEDEAWFCSLLVGKVAAFVTMFGRLGLSPADRRGGRRRQSKLTTGRYTAAGNEMIRFQPARIPPAKDATPQVKPVCLHNSRRFNDGVLV